MKRTQFIPANLLHIKNASQHVAVAVVDSCKRKTLCHKTVSMFASTFRHFCNFQPQHRSLRVFNRISNGIDIVYSSLKIQVQQKHSFLCVGYLLTEELKGKLNGENFSLCERK